MVPRVLHVITSLEMGGAEIMLCRLVEAGLWRDGNALVISLESRSVLAGRVEAAGVRVRVLNIRGSLPSPAAAWRLRREVRRFAPALIQGWMYHGNLAALMSRSLSGSRAPVVWSIRHSVYDLAVEKRTTAVVIRLGAFLSHRADHLLYNSETSAQQHEALGYEVTRRTVIPNGFDTEEFAPSPKARAGLRRRLGVASDAILVGRIGRNHPMKDHLSFLAAAASLHARRKDVSFVLAGKGLDRSNRTLASQIARLGLGDAVHLLGEESAVSSLIVGLDIACSSSAWGEAFPNVIGEAMACGVPCVVTDVGDSARMVRGVGRVVVPRDPRALAAALIDLIDAGPEERRRLGLEARKRVIARYSLSDVVRRYQDLYDQVLAEYGARP